MSSHQHTVADIASAFREGRITRRRAYLLAGDRASALDAELEQRGSSEGAPTVAHHVIPGVTSETVA